MIRVPLSQSHILYTGQDQHDIIINSIDEAALGPTRSLWLGNIPASTTSYALQAIFSSYGTVESARVLPHKNCGFVNFVNVESAIQAREVLNGKELFSGTGPCRVSFTKVVDLQSIGLDQPTDTVHEFQTSSQTQPQQQPPAPQQSPQKQSPAAQPQQSVQPVSPSAQKDELANIEYSVTDKETTGESTLLEPPKTLEEIADDLVTTVADLGADPTEQALIAASVKRALDFKTFYSEIGTVPDPRPDRIYDAPTLREVRKKIDSGSCTPEEIEDIALDILDEIAELSSDYVGNTVVQKLFDSCSEPIKDMMLKKISPYMSQISIHKNGTWAAQKIIAVAGTSRQINMIIEALHPYTVHLFLDQFGNYAIQCVLKFGSPWNDFIFETMLSKFWDIAQGRFGARAMRACLESHYVNKEQQRMIASAITMHAVQLATNANGALLLTWFLDTYTVPNRHTILAPKLIPHLVQLGTHKLASLTVLKVVNYRSEPGARQAIFDTLFNPTEEAPSQVLEQILDHPYGPTFIFKIVSTPLLEGQERQNAITKIRQVLIAIKALPSQGYKRLMDEVGLSTRTTGSVNPNVGGANVQSGRNNSNMNGGGNNNNNNNNNSRGYHHHQYQPRGGQVHRQRQGNNGNSNPGMAGMMQQPLHSQYYQQQPMMGLTPQVGIPPQQPQQQPQPQPQQQQPQQRGNSRDSAVSGGDANGNGPYIQSNEMMYQYNQYQQHPPQQPQSQQPQMMNLNASPGVNPGNPYELAMMQQQFDSMSMNMSAAPATSGPGGIPAHATGPGQQGAPQYPPPGAGAYVLGVNGMPMMPGAMGSQPHGNGNGNLPAQQQMYYGGQRQQAPILQRQQQQNAGWRQ